MSEATRYAFPPAMQPSIPVTGSDAAFPVRRIWCIGRNYAEHAREMGANPDREPPFFFAKPSDAVVAGGGRIAFPPMTSDLQHEVELAVALGLGGSDIAPSDALDCVFGYAVALDMTRRDLQAGAKRMARPWDMGKGFDQSCPIGSITRAEDIALEGDMVLQLTVNGTLRQRTMLREMIWSIAESIAELSRFVTLSPGDLLLTGTPAGVAAVKPGDQLEATCTGLDALHVNYFSP